MILLLRTCQDLDSPDHEDRNLPGTAPSLSSIFRPRSIAIVGASDRPGSRSAELLGNLRSVGYPGAILPVNPGRDRVADLQCWPSLSALPEVPEMVTIGLASDRVLDVVREAIGAGSKALAIVAAGFAEAGPAGAALQEEIARLCREANVLLCGPNCLGVWSRIDRVSYWLAEGNPLPESGLGLVIQSGALASSIMDPMERRGISFDVIATVGNEAVLTAGDYLGEMASDPRIRAMAVVVEAIRDADRFLGSVDDAVARGKPVFVVKLGRSDAGRRAAMAHTASVAGEDLVARAVLAQHGATLVDDLDELIEHLVLARAYPAGIGQRVLYVTVSGAGAGLVGDLATSAGSPPVPLDPSVAGQLTELLPGVHVGNPLDIAWAGDQPGVFAKCLEIAARSTEIDAVAVALNVAHAIHPDGTRFYLEQVEAAGAFRASGKPTVVLTLTAGDLDPAIADASRRLDLPLLAGARPAVSAIVRATGGMPERRTSPASTGDDPSIRASGGTVPAPTGEILDEVESKRILASWGLRPVAEEVVGSVDAALEAAARIGYPVVLKALVAGVTHKSELDVVRLGIASPDRLRVAYVEIEERVRSAGMALEGVVIQASIEQAHELLVGIKVDDVFGPIVVLGWGGIFVEILRETSIRRAPLRREDAIAMIDGLRGIEILKGARGRPPSDLEALVRTLLGLSDFAIGADSSIEAVDVNPLMLGAVGEGAVMVDASIQTRASHA